jgi:hypothetical protein
MTQSVTRVASSLRPLNFFLVTVSILLISNVAMAQRKAGSHAAAGATAAAAEEPTGLFNQYRGVQLGMTAEEVRKKLGEPKEKGSEQDFYIFGEAETALFVYDKTQKLIALSADFLTAGSDTLTAKQVFGSDVEAKPDGSIYKMVRFPKAGYWLSYNRTGGTAPLTTVTIQKIQ